jgi:predicted RND superfamily exporter protein
MPYSGFFVYCLSWISPVELNHTLRTNMDGELRKTYFMLLVPAVIGFIALFCIRSFHFLDLGTFQFRGIIAAVLFILSVIFAIGLPIFLRSLFAHRVRDQKSVSEVDLLQFERTFLYIALITPYVTLAAFLFEIPRFYCAGTVIMALYAVYYYYPSERRIQFERRIFRVK